jgi:hypothetical protein
VDGSKSVGLRRQLCCPPKAMFFCTYKVQPFCDVISCNYNGFPLLGLRLGRVCELREPSPSPLASGERYRRKTLVAKERQRHKRRHNEATGMEDDRSQI